MSAGTRVPILRSAATGARASRRILQKSAMTIPARYENGVFRPLQDVVIKKGYGR